MTKKYKVVYSRIRNKYQSLDMQEFTAKNYLKSLNECELDNHIIFISDIGVSYGSTDKVSGISKLRKMVEGGEVEELILYSRDRISRNRKEYFEFVNCLINQNVKVTFTSSIEPPFQYDLSLESVDASLIEMRYKEIKEEFIIRRFRGEKTKNSISS